MKHFLCCTLLFIIFQLCILSQVSALDNATCVVAKCKGRNTSGPGSDLIKKCRCDSDCSVYGDCCIDSVYKNKTKSTPDYQCLEIKLGHIPGVYVKRACSQSYSISRYRTRRKCQSSKNLDEQTSDYTLKLPVIGSNGVHYGNKYCASCDRITNFTFWDIHFSCEEHDTQIFMNNATVFNSSLYFFNDTLQKWMFKYKNMTETCALFPIPPDNYLFRQCRPNVVNSCPKLSSPYTKQCLDYTSLVKKEDGGYYKNEYCALCNNVSSADLTCRRKSNSSTSTTTMPTSISVSSTRGPTSSSARTTNRISTSPQFFPFFNKTSNTNNTNNTTQVREFLHIVVKQNCQDFVDSLTMAKLTIEMKTFNTMKRTHIKEANLISGYPIRICKGKETGTIVEDGIQQGSRALKIFVNLAVFVSIVFTLSHLFDFFFLCIGSTLGQKNFASYAIALAIGNVAFFASNATENFCHLLGPIAYFGFLSSFFWLMALAFDISCKIWCCVQECDLLGKNVTNSEKFTTYSLISWIFPTIIIFIMIYVAEKNGDFILEGRIYETCWFQNDETLLIFFAFPLTITMSVNLAFYLFSAYVVWIQRTVVVKLFAKHGIDFKFHTGLIITSNLMWSTALIAMYYDDSFLWVCFACLNATLGLLVYLCSPVKHAFYGKISAYLNQRFLPVYENVIQK